MHNMLCFVSQSLSLLFSLNLTFVHCFALFPIAVGTQNQPQVCAKTRSPRQWMERTARSVAHRAFASLVRLARRPQRVVRLDGHFTVLRGSGLQRESTAPRQRLKHLLQIHTVLGRGLEQRAAVAESAQHFRARHRVLFGGQVHLVRADDGGHTQFMFGSVQCHFGG